MGAGKTTVGRALAKALRMPFYDLDWYIEQRMHCTVKQIFDQRGEESFRKVERNMLHEVAEFDNVVLSCGGGTPCFFDNIDKHLKMGRNVRPLLLNKTPDEVRFFIQQQLAQREPFYTKAKHTLDVTLLDNHQKVQTTIHRMCDLLGIDTENIETTKK